MYRERERAGRERGVLGREREAGLGASRGLGASQGLGVTQDSQDLGFRV